MSVYQYEGRTHPWPRVRFSALKTKRICYGSNLCKELQSQYRKGKLAYGLTGESPLQNTRRSLHSPHMISSSLPFCQARWLLCKCTANKASNIPWSAKYWQDTQFFNVRWVTKMSGEGQKTPAFIHSPKFIPIGIGIPSWIPNSAWNSNLNMDLNWNSKLNCQSFGRVFWIIGEDHSRGILW